jgi:hypothetical protein
LPGSWSQTFAHNSPSQRADAIDQVKAQSAHSLRRQKVAQERSIEKIDHQGAAADIGLAHRLISREYIRVADIKPMAMGCDGHFTNRRGIAETQIEPLCADWWYDVGGFSNQCDALVGKTSRCCDVKGELTSPWLDLDFPDYGM